MDLKEVFNAIGSQMLVDFEHFNNQIKHLGERGVEREVGLAGFLQSYLPGQYAISSGEIVDVSGATSQQCDLIVFDSSNCPLLLAGKHYRIFPAEPVYAVVEVKSKLTISELGDAVEKIKTVKSLHRENGWIAGVLFAYKSSWKTNQLHQIATHLQGMNAGIPWEKTIDIVCVLDAGLIEIYPHGSATEEQVMWVYHDLDVPVLLWFFVRLLDLLKEKKAISPDYQSYIFKGVGGPIGRADLFELK